MTVTHFGLLVAFWSWIWGVHADATTTAYVLAIFAFNVVMTSLCGRDRVIGLVGVRGKTCQTLFVNKKA